MYADYKFVVCGSADTKLRWPLAHTRYHRLVFYAYRSSSFNVELLVLMEQPCKILVVPYEYSVQDEFHVERQVINKIDPRQSMTATITAMYLWAASVSRVEEDFGSMVSFLRVCLPYVGNRPWQSFSRVE